MSFQSVFFIFSFLVLVVVLAVVRKEIARQLIILFASFLFYGLWDWRFLFFVFICIFTMYFGCVLMLKDREHNGKAKKLVLTICIVILLGILGVLKYFDFFVSGFCSLLGIESSFSLNLILPVGISFYTFSAIGFIIDVYRGEIQEKVPIYQIAFYVVYFPKVLQGPICKADGFLNQLKNEHRITWANISSGSQFFVFGLIKKLVIADRLGLFIDTVYATPKAFSGLSLLLVALSYPIQLYCDFSGYTDMAIGTSRILGYDLCQNFNIPFISKTVAEYWRRWHMSLNIWFRDYLFYPIIRSNWVGRIRKRAKTKSKRLAKVLPPIIGMLIVWPLVGLWHGASFNFVLYGTIYGLLMIIGQLYDSFGKQIPNTKVLDSLRIIRTFVFTVILLILFRVPDLKTFGLVVSRILTMHDGIKYYYTWSFLFISLVLGLSVFAYLKNKGDGYYLILDLSKMYNKIIFCTVVLLTIIFMYVGENYFMYFKF